MNILEIVHDEEPKTDNKAERTNSGINKTREIIKIYF